LEQATALMWQNVRHVHRASPKKDADIDGSAGVIDPSRFLYDGPERKNVTDV